MFIILSNHSQFLRFNFRLSSFTNSSKELSDTQPSNARRQTFVYRSSINCTSSTIKIRCIYLFILVYIFRRQVNISLFKSGTRTRDMPIPPAGQVERLTNYGLELTFMLIRKSSNLQSVLFKSLYRIKINIRSAIPAYQRTLHKVVSIGCIATLRRFFRIIHLRNFIFSLSFQFEVFLYLPNPENQRTRLLSVHKSSTLSDYHPDKQIGTVGCLVNANTEGLLLFFFFQQTLFFLTLSSRAQTS